MRENSEAYFLFKYTSNIIYITSAILLIEQTYNLNAVYNSFSVTYVKKILKRYVKEILSPVSLWFTKVSIGDRCQFLKLVMGMPYHKQVLTEGWKPSLAVNFDLARELRLFFRLLIAPE